MLVIPLLNSCLVNQSVPIDADSLNIATTLDKRSLYTADFTLGDYVIGGNTITLPIEIGSAIKFLSGRLDYSTDGGTTFINIATLTGSETSVNWSVPALNQKVILKLVVIGLDTDDIEVTHKTTIDSINPVVAFTTSPAGTIGGSATTVQWSLTETNFNSSLNFYLLYSTNGVLYKNCEKLRRSIICRDWLSL